MNKIRKYLIHLLGGVTEEELNWSIKYAVRRTGYAAADAMLLFMKNCNGMHADEWCKNVYGTLAKFMSERRKVSKSFRITVITIITMITTITKANSL